jgi:hypothetical protein
MVFQKGADFIGVKVHVFDMFSEAVILNISNV